MSATLTPGFTGIVQIKDSAGTVLYNQKCTSEEQLQGFISHFGTSKPGWSLLSGCMMPLRTHNLPHFSKDFFLPTFIHFALTIDFIALKIIASTFAIIYDLITFPIRVVTAPFRIYYNAMHPEAAHPITGLLTPEQRAKDLHKAILCYKTTIVNIDSPNYTNDSNKTIQHASKSTTKGSIQLALENMPHAPRRYTSETEKNKQYIRFNAGNWVCQSSGSSSSSHYTTSL